MSDAIHHYEYWNKGQQPIPVLNADMSSLVWAVRILSSSRQTTRRSGRETALASDARKRRRVSMVQIEQRMRCRTTRVESQRSPRVCQISLSPPRLTNFCHSYIDTMCAMRAGKCCAIVTRSNGIRVTPVMSSMLSKRKIPTWRRTGLSWLSPNNARMVRVERQSWNWKDVMWWLVVVLEHTPVPNRRASVIMEDETTAGNASAGNVWAKSMLTRHRAPSFDSAKQRANMQHWTESCDVFDQIVLYAFIHENKTAQPSSRSFNIRLSFG